MTGRFIAVVGPSGVGKDSVMAAMAARDPRISLARRIITRPADAGGECFDGVTEDEFETRKARGEFALSWAAHDLHYAIPATVTAQIASGQDVLANLSRAALVQARARFERVEIISLSADRTVLAARLSGRGRETADQIAGRLARVGLPLPDGMVAHHIDNSGPLAQTVRAASACLYPVSA